MNQPSGAGTALAAGGPVGRRVLVVDDEQPLAKVIASYLERDGFEVALAYEGQSAPDLARRVDPDVVVLGVGLPVLDGVEVCRVPRCSRTVMLTAPSEEVDKLIGLSVGADDYTAKPFSPRELLARVHVMLRRPRARPGHAVGQRGTARVFDPLAVDVAGREVHLADQRRPRGHAHGRQRGHDSPDRRRPGVTGPARLQAGRAAPPP